MFYFGDINYGKGVLYGYRRNAGRVKRESKSWNLQFDLIPSSFAWANRSKFIELMKLKFLSRKKGKYWIIWAIFQILYMSFVDWRIIQFTKLYLIRHWFHCMRFSELFQPFILCTQVACQLFWAKYIREPIWTQAKHEFGQLTNTADATQLVAIQLTGQF